MATRALEEALARIDETRSRARAKPKLKLMPEVGKGKPPPRKRPDDFEIIFIQIGRLACETFFRASRITVTRWLEECGKERVVKLRAAFVQRQPRSLGSLRDFEAKVAPAPVAPVHNPVDEDPMSVCLVSSAAHFLRMPGNGGWRVSPAHHGTWNVGMKRMTAAALLTYACSKGFNVDQAMLSCEIEREMGLE